MSEDVGNYNTKNHHVVNYKEIICHWKISPNYLLLIYLRKSRLDGWEININLQHKNRLHDGQCLGWI